MTATTWNLDPAHTDVIFAAKHMMVTTVRGKFAAVEGVVQLDPENPTASRGSFTVKAASLNTGVEQRDGHLRSADFFDADHYPDVTFTASSVEHKGGDNYLVTGDLTIRDVTRPFSFDVEYLGLFTAMSGARRAGFHATGKLNREEFGLTWNVTLETGGWLVGKEIKLEIDLALDESVAVPAAVVAASAS